MVVAINGPWRVATPTGAAAPGAPPTFTTPKPAGIATTSVPR